MLLLMVVLLFVVVLLWLILSTCCAKVKSEEDRMSDDVNPLSEPEPLFLEDSEKSGPSPGCGPSNGENEMIPVAVPLPVPVLELGLVSASVFFSITPILTLTGVTQASTVLMVRICISGEGGWGRLGLVGLIERIGRRGLGVEGGLLD